MPLILRAKTLIIGDAAAGKSSLVQMFHSDGQHFPKNYSMTTGVELLVKSVLLPQSGGDQVELQLYDCSGKAFYSDVVDNLCDRPNLCVLVFDVTSDPSFARCSELLTRLQSKFSGGLPVPTALVAHKVDLDSRRIVTSIQGQEFAQNNGLMYFEVSSKEGQNVDSPFTELAKKFAEMYSDKCAQVADML